MIECECGCWYWTGSCDSSGYAKFKLRQKTIQVHRYAYERLLGEIADEMTLDHLNCTSRRCIRPDHMEQVSRGINSTRANATRWHDLKFDDTGNAVDRAKCEACKARDTDTSLSGFAATREPASGVWHDAEPLSL